jgi:hypothetical protein
MRFCALLLAIWRFPLLLRQHLGRRCMLELGPPLPPRAVLLQAAVLLQEFGEFHVAGQLLQEGHSSRSVY